MKPTASGRGQVAAMDFKREKVRITQHVEVVPGKSRLLDTCLIYYIIKNNDTQPRSVGLRVMLDTYIGDNDGVPFLVPGERDFLTTMHDYKTRAEAPPYLEAVENPEN